MPFRLPPDITWPAFIIALFGAGTISTLSMIWIADSDGGAQVIDNYYEKAVAWNETATRQAASDALGWDADLAVGPAEGTEGYRTLRIAVRDSAGNPVDGLRGTVQLYRPQYAAPLHEAGLLPDPTAPGVYRQHVPLRAAGLWDFKIEASRDSAVYLTTIRREISL